MYHILNAKGAPATPKEIASHYNVIMMAGAVTTATFLSGTLYYLCHNRQALHRLQDEMRNMFNSIDDINSKELLKCTYLNAVVEEGLRIYPPAGAAHLSRIVPKGGCEISGSFIPEGVCSLPSVLSFPLHTPFPSSLASVQRLRYFKCLRSTPTDPRIRPPLVHPPRPHQFPRSRKIHSRALARHRARRSNG